MIVADLSIIPIGTNSPSISKYVRAALEGLKSAGVKFEIGAMSTTIETKNLDTLFLAVKVAHNAVFKAGADRTLTSIRIDDRRDKEISIASKLEAVK
jgi:uncharacterized protein (TIGR00106 family)